MKEAAKHRTEWIIHKFRDPDGVLMPLLRSGIDAEEMARLYPDRFIGVERAEGNCLLNEGIQYLWDIVTGIEASPTLWDNGNARVGVGSDDTAASAAQMGLLDAGAEYATMDATYPKRTDETMAWRGTFGDGDAEFAWEEYTVDNGDEVNLNRKVESKGTKGAGESWTLTLEITLT